jgi:hypothetical protein
VPKGQTAVTCWSCGAEGYEQADDPCPGLCPLCFDRALAEETEVLLGEVRRFSREEAQRRHELRMRVLGVTEAVLDRERRMVEQYRRASAARKGVEVGHE